MDGCREQGFVIKDGILESYTLRGTEVVLPQEIHTIGEGAFKGCVSLEKVVLPRGLKKIGAHAFKGCRKLQEIQIPDGVKEIGEYAFHRCHALKNIILPPSVTELGNCVFLYCDSLEEIRMPGVRRLGKQVFLNDVCLKKLEICRNLNIDCICDVFNGCGRIAEIAFADGETYHIGNAVNVVTGECAVPDVIGVIAEDILRMMELDGRCLVKFLTNIKHVEIPEGIDKIGKSCFFDKRGILSVKLPKSLRVIESRAFRNCINLEKVVFLGEIAGIQVCEDAFKNCTTLKEIQTMDGKLYQITGILEESAEEQSEAISEKLPQNVPEILSEEPFKKVPELIKQIHRQVLGNFRISGTILLQYLGAESRVVVPDGITAIAEEAFAKNEAIDRVLLPESLTEIGAGAFRDCLLLQTIPFPKKLKQIGESAFENCVKLIRAELPPELFMLEAKAFKRCQVLREVEFPDCLQEIREQAFYGCRALKHVELGDQLQKIGDMAWYRCENLQEITLPKGIQSVGNLAFAESGVKQARILGSGIGWGRDIFTGCRRLCSVQLEHGVQHIPDKFAYHCDKLKQVQLPKSLKSVGRNVWEGTPFLKEWTEKARKSENAMQENSGTMHVEDAGNAGDCWEILWDGRYLRGEVWIPEGTRIVAGGAFYGNTEITQVHIPESVIWVGASAFKGCRALQCVYWHAKTDRLEAEVFAGDIALQTVKLETERQKYENTGECKEDRENSEYAEQESSYVTAGECGEERENRKGGRSSRNWKEIGDRAFYECRSMQRINLKEVLKIGKEAFYGCRQLKETGILKNTDEKRHEKFHEEPCRELYIGENAFEKTEFLQKDDICIVGGVVVSATSAVGEVRLSEGIRGIAPFAFSRNQNIIKIVFPESLVWIGEGAFWGCNELKSVQFSGKVRRIGRRAFEKCTKLSEISVDAGGIGQGAFRYCTALKTAQLFGVSVLEKGLFEGCAALKVCKCRDAVQTVQEVKAQAFSGCIALEQFDLSRVRMIGKYAFAGCCSIRQIVLGGASKENEDEGENRIEIAPHAFEDCCGLEEIKIIKAEDGKQHVLCVREYAFSGCTALRFVRRDGNVWQFQEYRTILDEKVPQMVRMLFHSAMSCFVVEREEELCGYRGSARRIKIPQGIRTIHAEVFKDVLMLKEVEIPASVEYIGARAFHGTAWLAGRQQESPMVTVNHMLLDGSACRGEVVVPEEIRLVCGWAFANGMEIQKIRFLSERVRVEEYAFRNCIYLKEIVLADGTCFHLSGIEDRQKEWPPLVHQAVMERLNCFKTDENGVLRECTGNISRLALAEGITEIGDGVFQEGNLLTEVTLAESVQKIGKAAFARCKWLRSVKMVQSVTELGDMAFSGCQNLETVEEFQALRKIGARAFEHCTSLREIVVPDGVEEIPMRAFFRCHALWRVVLPDSVKKIGKEAFAFCRALEEIRIETGTADRAEDGRFLDTAIYTIQVEARAFVGCERLKGPESLERSPQGIEMVSFRSPQGTEMVGFRNPKGTDNIGFRNEKNRGDMNDRETEKIEDIET